MPALVAIVPVNLSLTGGAAGWLTGDPGSSSVRLAVLVVATLIELGFVRQISSSGCLTMNHQKNWDQCRSIGSYETLLTRLAIVTLAVACLMFVMPPSRMPASQG